MFSPWSASTPSVRCSVPGSLRTESASVVRRRPSVGRSPGAARRRRRSGSRAMTRKRVRLRGSDWMSGGEDLEAEQVRGPRREHRGRAALAALARSSCPAPAVFVVASSDHGRVRRNASACPSAWMCEYTRSMPSSRSPGSAARQSRTGTMTSPTMVAPRRAAGRRTSRTVPKTTFSIGSTPERHRPARRPPRRRPRSRGPASPPRREGRQDGVLGEGARLAGERDDERAARGAMPQPSGAARRERPLVPGPDRRPALPDRVLERVGERLRGRRDDVRRRAHRGPGRARRRPNR